eukprot:5576835-Heterocapsa_arctica.AAC.1
MERDHPCLLGTRGPPQANSDGCARQALWRLWARRHGASLSEARDLQLRVPSERADEVGDEPQPLKRLA